jgi:hypothetical protein
MFGERILLAQAAREPPSISGVSETPTAHSPSVIVNVSPSGTASTARPAGTVDGDVAGIIQVVAWPLILLILAVILRNQIRGIFTYAASHLKSVSIAGVSIELTERTAPPLVQTAGAAVDIRHAGTENNVNDSTLRSFYAQIEAAGALELAIVDLGQGHEWLTSRLYILSVILTRMRGLKAIVFVDNANNSHGRFIGICPSGVLRWRLANEFPKYEEALASGEMRAAGAAAQPIMQTFIDNDDGRFADRNMAADLLRGFLTWVQSPSIPPGQTAELWQFLEVQPPNPQVFEYAKWIDAPLIEKLLEGALDNVAVPLTHFQFANRDARSRIVFDHKGTWVPLVRADGRFHGWIDRGVVVEALAGRILDAP